ncbi:hypothetical protein A9P82_09855 [Arachidicoccus ginsenosidimutans]|uniref:YraN family protein n=1 Tax=Arachidicoccus sp. BS20 TaxID=1850526 RepID=UPI0007F0CD43|nr:YraN family protein [Arachidicoccus sp. BS20]ANI89568.1 hypothetical protein A9P82_09855 [Arachidicoccus sp. BS20]
MHNKNVGDKGENLATVYLEKLGYKILYRNWRFKFVEIDIIASKENVLHFIEVKTRTGAAFGRPEEAVTKKKMEQMKLGAEEFQYRNPQWKRVQFDVLAIRIFNDGNMEYWLNKDVYF